MPPLHLPLLVRMAVLSMALASTGSMARSADSSATQPATAPAAAPAADVERLLSPFVDDTTLAVLRVDVSKLQWDVLRDWSIKLLSDSGLPEVDRKRADAAIVDGCARAKMWSEAFVKAGGAHIYLVGNFNTLAPVYGLVPLQNGADAERITGMLRQIGLANGINPFAEKTGAIEVRRQGDLLVSGPPNAVQSALDMAGDPKRTKRSDLAVALAAGGDAALVLAFSPTAEQKEALATNEPKLPEALGGGSTAEAVADFTYAALWATVPQAQSPSADLRIRIKAKDAAAAARLKFLMLRLIASMQGHDGDKPNVLELATLFKSELVDDHIEITLNQAGMEGVAKVVAALFIQSREVAMQLPGHDADAGVGVDHLSLRRGA